MNIFEIENIPGLIYFLKKEKNNLHGIIETIDVDSLT